MLRQNRGECHALRIELKALVTCVEQQAAVFQGEEGANREGTTGGDRRERKDLVTVIEQEMEGVAGDKPEPARLVASEAVDE